MLGLMGGERFAQAGEYFIRSHGAACLNIGLPLCDQLQQADGTPHLFIAFGILENGSRFAILRDNHRPVRGIDLFQQIGRFAFQVGYRTNIFLKFHRIISIGLNNVRNSDRFVNQSFVLLGERERSDLAQAFDTEAFREGGLAAVAYPAQPRVGDFICQVVPPEPSLNYLRGHGECLTKCIVR